MITLNGAPVLGGYISQPYNGAWVAELSVAIEEPISGTVVLSDENGQSWIGTVRRGGVFSSRWHGFIVGGGDGIKNTLGAKNYRSGFVGKIILDICSEAGEVQSPLITPAVLGQNLTFWSRPSGTGGEALATLAGELGVQWRVLPAGVVWLGEDSGQRSPIQYQPLDANFAQSFAEFAPAGLDLKVGEVQNSLQVPIVRVDYHISDRLRAKVWI